MAPLLKSVYYCRRTHGPTHINLLMEPFVRNMERSHLLNWEMATMFKILWILQSCGIVHGDVKPDQFLQDENGKIVLTDYGNAGQIPEDLVRAWKIKLRKINVLSTPSKNWQSLSGIYPPILGWGFGPFQMINAPIDETHELYPVLPYFDLLSLELWYRRETFFVRHQGQWHRFVGIQGIPEKAREIFDSHLSSETSQQIALEEAYMTSLPSFILPKPNLLLRSSPKDRN